MKSIVQTDLDYCFYCQGNPTDTHHIFGASNRKLSDEDGLVIRVCRNCHNKLHNGPGSADLSRKLRQLAQTKWEANYKCDGDPRTAFMLRYGRNWK